MRIKKIIIELEDSESLELEVGNSEFATVTKQIGMRKVPGEYGSVKAELNGLTFTSILIGSESIVRDIDGIIKSELENRLNGF